MTSKRRADQRSVSRAFRPGDQDHSLEEGTPALGAHASPGDGTPGPVRRAQPEEQRGHLLSCGALARAPVDEHKHNIAPRSTFCKV